MAKKSVKSAGGFRARLLGVMSYLGILCFIPLIRGRNDEFISFHARQGMVIWMLGVVGILSLYLPGLGKWMFSVSLTAVLVFSVIGITSALMHRAWKLPIIHSISNYL